MITTHVVIRALENRSTERARDPELGIWTRECVLASALYTMTVGVALLVQGLRSSKRAISPQGTTPALHRQEVWDARLKHTRI